MSQRSGLITVEMVECNNYSKTNFYFLKISLLAQVCVFVCVHDLGGGRQGSGVVGIQAHLSLSINGFMHHCTHSRSHGYNTD